MSYLDSRIIILNSSHGISLNGSYKSNLFFTFNGLLTQEDNIEQVQISLVNAQISVSFYTINYTNNVFKIEITTLKLITIPVGNYNANSLITILNTLIDDSYFSITISCITGKIKFSHNKDFIIYTDNDCSIGTILGLLYATIPLNLLGYKRLEIYTEGLQTYNYSSLNNGMNCLRPAIFWINNI